MQSDGDSRINGSKYDGGNGLQLGDDTRSNDEECEIRIGRLFDDMPPHDGQTTVKLWSSYVMLQ